MVFVSSEIASKTASVFQNAALITMQKTNGIVLYVNLGIYEFDIMFLSQTYARQ